MSYERMTGMGQVSSSEMFPDQGTCSQIPNGMKTWTYDFRIDLTELGCKPLGTNHQRQVGSATIEYPQYCCPHDIAVLHKIESDRRSQQIREEAQRLQRERFDRCVSAGYPVTWEPDIPLTRAQAHAEHFGLTPNICNPSGKTRPGSMPSIANLDKEVCCYPRNAELTEKTIQPTVPTEALPVTTNGQPATTNGQPQLAMDQQIPWKWIAITALGVGALVWLLKR